MNETKETQGKQVVFFVESIYRIPYIILFRSLFHVKDVRILLWLRWRVRNIHSYSDWMNDEPTTCDAFFAWLWLRHIIHRIKFRLQVCGRKCPMTVVFYLSLVFFSPKIIQLISLFLSLKLNSTGFNGMYKTKTRREFSLEKNHL